MQITAQMVKELRDTTGAGMMDCKKALTECEGDLAKAIDYLKEKGIAKAAKKASRIAAEGLVRIATSEDQKTAALVEVNSETDFVAKNPEFITFVEDMSKLALDSASNDMEAFKAMSYEGTTVGEALTSKIAKIGENLTLRRIDKVSGEVLSTYIHGGGRIGVVVVGKGDTSQEAKAALTNVAMQVAAMNPQYVSREDITADELEKLKTITIESSLNDPFNLPKPILNELLDKAVNGVWSKEDIDILEEKRADKKFNFNFITNFISEEAKAKLAELSVANRATTIANKMFAGAIEGRVSKQLKEICLLDQTYVRAEDGKQTVAQYLASVSKDLKLDKVVRFEVGEGLEKRNENFAEEVAKQMQG